MNGNFPLDITKLPFSGRKSRCMIFYETNGEALDAENGMYLSQNTEGMLGGGAQFYRNKNYLLITPMKDGKELEYTYCADISAVQIKTEKGNIDITFASDGSMRIYANNVGIRLTAKMGFGDVAMMCASAAEADMDGAVYYMIPSVGRVTVDSHYDLLTYRYTDPVIDFIPDNGTLEIAVFDHTYKDMPEPEITGSFEECRKDMQEEFVAFTKKVLPVADSCLTEIYGLWISCKSFPDQPGGMYMSNVITKVYPRAAEQPVISLAFADVDEAVELINKFTKYITPAGLVPEQTNRTRQIFQTGSMDYGYAVLEMMKKGKLSTDKLKTLYNLLATVDGWWTANRSHDGGVSFFYAYRFEAGNVGNDIFDGGTPTVAADLMTRMICEAYALSKLAGGLGLENAEKSWSDIAEKRLEFLTEKLWQNGRFVSLTGDKSIVCGSAICYMPLMLGAHLPKEIAKTLADSLIASDLVVPGRGIKAESSDNETDTVLTAFLAAGLADCGFYDKAETIVDWLTEASNTVGLDTVIAAEGTPGYRCGSLFAPAVCAAKIFCTGKIG